MPALPAEPPARDKILIWYTIFQQEPDMPHPNVVAESSSAGYLRLLLSRPDQRNALVPGMVVALTEAMQADSDAVVLLGSTDPGVFCAGADLSLPIADRAAVSDLLYECYEHMVTRPGPVIAVVGGPAVGGGAQLAAASDLRIAGPGARLRWTGPAGAGLAVGAWILPDLVGRAAALEIGMTGRWVDAAEALALGLVYRVEDDPDQVAADLAEALCTVGPLGPGRIKGVMSAGGLLDRLQAERSANRAAFDEALQGSAE
jgi:enoyl-CoA hydratase